MKKFFDKYSTLVLVLLAIGIPVYMFVTMFCAATLKLKIELCFGLVCFCSSAIGFNTFNTKHSKQTRRIALLVYCISFFCGIFISFYV